jgi:succinate dehydrogenase/fumarate reductase flavoprotein subunit
MAAHIDIVVVGGGMAGLAAAAAATEAGARVVVLEKAPEVGGSAAMSVGMFWVPPDLESLRQRVPLGDAELGRAVVEAYPAAVARIRALGVAVGERVNGVMTVGIGHSIDVRALLATEVAEIERGGGQVLCGTAAKRLVIDADGTVRGAQTRERTVLAAATILATGGFQGDPDLRTTYLGVNADRLVLRSNPGSVGDGLRLGRSAGGATSRAMASFYGHLLPNPVPGLTADQFIPMAQYHSSHCILVNLMGRRFCDESTGDEVSNQLLLAQPEARGVLLCDERVHAAHVVGEPFPNLGMIDRFAVAAAAGARYTSADSIDALVGSVAAWGVDPVGLRQTLDGYAAAAAGQAVRLDAPLPATPQPLVEPPLHALEVVPAITFTYGGMRTDVDGRVLDHDGVPVPGLWAAGVDAGGLSNHTYAGGLAPAYITGRRAGAAAAARAAAATAGSAMRLSAT